MVRIHREPPVEGPPGGLCLRTTSCPKTPVLAQKPQGYWFIVKKRIIESEIAARLTADKSDDRYFADVFLERCAECVPQLLERNTFCEPQPSPALPFAN